MSIEKIEAAAEISEHELMRVRQIVGDRLAEFQRQPVAPSPAVLIAKLQLCLIEWDVAKEMLFGPGSQFEDLGMTHAYASLLRYQAWLEETLTEVNRQKLLAPPLKMNGYT